MKFFRPHSAWISLALVFLSVSSLMIFATNQLPMTWDEGDAIKRADKITQWFRSIPTTFGSNESPFSAQRIRAHWFHTNCQEGHPAGYTLTIAMGRVCAALPGLNQLPEKTQYRLGPIFLFSLAMTLVFSRIRKTFSTTAALLSIMAILLIPRVFAHAQIAACDAPLMASWLIVWALFDSGLKSRRGAILWGLALGLCFAMKFTGWLAPLPFLCWLLLYRFHCRFSLDSAREPDHDVLRYECREILKKGLRLFAWAIPVALLTFVIVNPNLWHNPFGGFLEFVRLNTNRETNYNFIISFLGDQYSFDHPLPWYNTIVWTAITVPLGILFFAVISLSVFFKRPIADNEEATSRVMGQRNTILLLVLNFMTLIVIRAIPGTPVHDGIRLFVAAFPFLGILAGLGAFFLGFEEKELLLFSGTIFLRRVSVAILLAVSCFNLYWYAPQWLSFYNAGIGGLKGAVAAGMETTYYWDGLDDDVLQWLCSHTTPDGLIQGKNDGILFYQCSPSIIRLNCQWGKLYNAKLATDSSVYGPEFRWYVFQHREGTGFSPDMPPLNRIRPAYQKTIRSGGFGPWRLGDTPLISIYDAHELLEALSQGSKE